MRANWSERFADMWERMRTPNGGPRWPQYREKPESNNQRRFGGWRAEARKAFHLELFDRMKYVRG